MSTKSIMRVGLCVCHLLAYSSLIGSNLYQSFIMTKLSCKALPIRSFIALQKSVFPVFFRLQTVLLIATIMTYPPGSLLSLFKARMDLGIFAVASTTTLLNWAKYGPATRTAMIERYGRVGNDNTENGSVDGTKSTVEASRRDFSRNHAMSIHLNLLSLGATMLYGVRLALKLSF